MSTNSTIGIALKSIPSPSSIPIQQAPPPKKRGRPAKTTQPSSKAYSLVKPNICPVLFQIQSTIIQLKILKERIDEFELQQYNIKSFNSSDPIPYNDNYTDMQMPLDNVCKGKIPIVPIPIIPLSKQDNICDKCRSVGNTNKLQPVIKNDVNDILKRDSGLLRKNLIINSGVEHKIIKIMHTGKTWPQQTNIACWYDCHTFTETPVGIPIRFYKNESGDIVFELDGNFCSYNCAAKYLNPHSENIDDISMLQSDIDITVGDERAQRNQLLEYLCYIETGMNIMEKIKLASSRFSLRLFGGKLTIEKYRENFNQHTTYHIFKNPYVPINYDLEEVNDTTAKKANTIINYSYADAKYKALLEQESQKQKRSATKLLRGGIA